MTGHDGELAVVEGRLTGLTTTANITLPRDCNAPAPLVVNGSPYVGCQLPVDHEGSHEVKVTWVR